MPSECQISGTSESLKDERNNSKHNVNQSAVKGGKEKRELQKEKNNLRGKGKKNDRECSDISFIRDAVREMNDDIDVLTKQFTNVTQITLVCSTGSTFTNDYALFPS